MWPKHPIAIFLRGSIFPIPVADRGAAGETEVVVEFAVNASGCVKISPSNGMDRDAEREAEAEATWEDLLEATETPKQKRKEGTVILFAPRPLTPRPLPQTTLTRGPYPTRY